MAKNEWITQIEFARRLGVGAPAIVNARKAGRFQEGTFVKENGKLRVLWPRAKKEFEESRSTLDTTAERSHDAAVNRARKEGKKVVDPVKDEAANATVQQLRQNKAALDMARAKMLYEKERGSLVPAEAVYKQLFELGQQIRSAIQNIPAQIVDDVMAAQTPMEATRIMDEAMALALKELSTLNNFRVK